MTVRVGTSGYNYDEWKGSFYPADLPASRMLAFYAERFDTVEINATFYRMPTPKTLAGWAAGTPAHFVFALKAPQRITHSAKLKGAEDAVATFVRTASAITHLNAADCCWVASNRTGIKPPSRLIRSQMRVRKKQSATDS